MEIALDELWFHRAAFSAESDYERDWQLSENDFNAGSYSVGSRHIQTAAKNRFLALDGITIAGARLFSSTDFQPAWQVGKEFLSHAVYANLLDQHIKQLRNQGRKNSEKYSVLGAIQNDFFIDSEPKHYFYGAQLWSEKKLASKRDKFEIDRPKLGVRKFVLKQSVRVKRKILTGYRTYERIGNGFDGLPEPDLSTEEQSLLDDEVSKVDEVSKDLVGRLDELLETVTDSNLASDLLSLIGILRVRIECVDCPVTPPQYQQIMDDWNIAPKPKKRATLLQAVLWRWLFVVSPGDRSKFFSQDGDSETDKDRKAQARHRRLKDLTNHIEDFSLRVKNG